MTDGRILCRRKRVGLLAVLTAALLAGCSQVRVRATKLTGQDQVSLATLAIVPLENLTATSHASSALTAIITSELRRRGQFRVVELERPTSGASERWTAAKLGTELKADAVLVGVVTAYDYQPLPRGGQAASPSIAVDLRVVAAPSGEVLWAAGFDAKQLHVFSADGMPIDALAQEVAEHVADELEDLQGD